MPRTGVDFRNLARVRTQVWFAEMALKSLLAEAAAADPLGQAATEDLLIPIVHLLELAQVKLSDRIDDAVVARPETPHALA
jgi:hypothetical protein